MYAKVGAYLALIALFWGITAFAPTDTPPVLYRFPMDGAEFLISGTYGELRPNHFHSGLDVKTGGEAGKPLYAVAPGYVYRIKVSPVGYGNAIYVRHKDGNFAVYGHMSRFSPVLESIVYQNQYATKRWEQEIYLSEDQVPVIPGQLLGYSGNSGSSQGPHLHFEVRDADEYTLNPLFFFRHLVKDDVQPILQRVAFQPLELSSRVNGMHQKLEIVPAGKQGVYQIPEIVTISGPVGLEYQGYDLLSGAANHCGINFSRLYLDNQLVFEFKLERFGFEEKRFINVHFDYGYFMRTGRRLERAYVESWNGFSAYQNTINHGVLDLKDDRVHDLRLELMDVHGNKSTCSAKVQRGAAALLPREFSYPGLTQLDGEIMDQVFVARLQNPSTAHLQGLDVHYPGGQVQRIRPAWFAKDALFYLVPLNTDPLPFEIKDPITGKYVDFNLNRLIDPSRNTVAHFDGGAAYFPEKSTYHPVPLQVKQTAGAPYMYSNQYAVGWPDVPLRSPFLIKIYPSLGTNPAHLVLAKKDSDGRWQFLGREREPDGAVFASSNTFGEFCLMADSVSPQISPINFQANGSIPASQSTLHLQVKDDFSGIDSHRLVATMDGAWMLFSYDAKSRSIEHQLKYRPKPGRHVLEVLVYDQANNLGSARFELNF